MTTVEIIVGGLATAITALFTSKAAYKKGKAEAMVNEITAAEKEFELNTKKLALQKEVYDQEKYQEILDELIETREQLDKHIERIQSMSRRIVELELKVQSLMAQNTLLLTTK